MSDPIVILTPDADLISRFFDQALTPEEQEELNGRICQDPSLAREFAATARLHAALEMRAPEVPLRKRRPVLRSLLQGAAALVTLAGALLLVHRATEHGWKVNVTDADGEEIEKPVRKIPPGLPRRVVKMPMAPAAAFPGSQEDLLAGYFVDLSPDGLTVPEALAQLEERMRELNLMKRPELDQIRFSAGLPIDPDDPDPLVRTAAGDGMTVLDYVRTCSGFRQVEMKPGGWSRGPEPLSVNLSDEPAMVEEIRVPPDFLGRNGDAGPEVEKNRTARRLEENYGITLDPDEGASFAHALSQVTLLASGKKRELFKYRVLSVLQQKARNAFLTTKLIRLSRLLLPAGFDESSGMIMTDEEYQRFMRQLSLAAGTNLLTAPSVIVRRSQKSSVEVKNELSGTAEWFGLEFSTEVAFLGELLRVEGMVDLGIMHQVTPSDPLRSLGMRLGDQYSAEEPVHHFQTEYELWLPDRMTGLFTVDSPEDGDLVTLVCLTATLIDPAGQPVNAAPAETIPVGVAAEGRPGFVLSPWAPDKGFVDVTEIPSGSKVKCPYTGKVFLVP